MGARFPIEWFLPSWWGYLLSKPADGWSLVNLWTSFNCRRRSHPAGPIYFNAGGLEPNMTCRGCGDDIG